MTDLLDYTGRTVVVTGAATGMGNETTRLLLDAGATVHTIDVAPVELDVAGAHECDLADAESIGSVVDSLPDRVDALMNCAGIPNGSRWDGADVMKVNFLGLRELTERLVDRIPTGGAVTNIASIAGNGWMDHLEQLKELLATPTFADGVAWCGANAETVGDGYFLSKEAVQYYTLWRGAQLVKTRVRMNSICPGVTDTKILVDFRTAMGDQAIDMTTDVGIGRPATAAEMAPAMLFLSHPEAASYVVGVNLVIDGGFTAAMTTEQVDFAKYFG